MSTLHSNGRIFQNSKCWPFCIISVVEMDQVTLVVVSAVSYIWPRFSAYDQQLVLYRTYDRDWYCIAHMTSVWYCIVHMTSSWYCIAHMTSGWYIWPRASSHCKSDICYSHQWYELLTLPCTTTDYDTMWAQCHSAVSHQTFKITRQHHSN